MVCDVDARASGRSRLLGLIATVSFGVLGICGLAASSAWAQAERQIPSLAYRAAFPDFQDGRYKDALREFLSEGRGAIKTPQSRWIDSICYESMAGECYYQMGHLNQALEHFTAAVQLAVAHSQWMRRVQFRPAIRPSASAARIPWGKSTRGARLGHYADSTPLMLGRIDNNQQIKQGGIVQQAHFRLIWIDEIVRCTTLAVRRRTQLLGPASRHDPLVGRFLAAMSSRPGPPNHWSEAWIDIQLALALVAAGKEEQALPYLQRAQVAAGDFDHPLTSTALLELGRLAMTQGKFAVAAEFFQEAGYAAVHYPNATLLDEAFRSGAVAHLMANQKGIYPPLAMAAEWANRKNLRQLRASLLISLAENHAVLGQTREAATALDAARSTIGRRQMAAGRIGCRLNFVAALVLFQQKKTIEGDSSLAAAMDFMQQGSHWLFRISFADGLYASGAIQPRTAMALYTELLRDPQPSDWAYDPMESMAVLLVPHPGPLQRWFDVANKRKEHGTALEIGDRLRRHRFFNTLPFGGRLLSLRWILEGPAATLDQQSQLLRRDLLARYPAYDQLSRQAAKLRDQLEAMPLVTDNAEAFRQQGRQLKELASLSTQQEAILREMALRREPAGLVFPPLRKTEDIQKALPDGHALLVFLEVGRDLYGFLLNNKDYARWKVGSASKVSEQLVELLREMEQYQPNHELTLKDLASEQWKESAQDMLDLILKGSRADFTQPFDQLVIVPDGVLWYLPFEALQVKIDGELQPLISRFQIRYVPTASLAVPDGPRRKPTGNTAVVTGRLFPRDDESVARDACEKIAGVLPGTVALKQPLPADSRVYGALFDRLIVLDDINLAGEGPYDWSPVSVERGKAGNSLAAWLQLPWQGPDEIVLPGYHTAAENSLKRINRAAAGREVFLSVCGLMSSGARTLLLSRWRSGGQTSFDLVREFAQELPHTSPADAWQRSVFVTVASQLELDAEPRVKHRPNDPAPKASHPFFWAGYMLVDSATSPQKPAEE